MKRSVSTHALTAVALAAFVAAALPRGALGHRWCAEGVAGQARAALERYRNSNAALADGYKMQALGGRRLTAWAALHAATLGAAHAADTSATFGTLILKLQESCFQVGAELATHDESMLAKLVRIGDDDVARQGVGRLNVLDLQIQIRRLPKPVIASIAGYAIGGGHILHLVCDLSIAADNARFGQTGPMVGSFDGGYGSSLLARTIGLKRAKEVWFLCRQYDAATALDWGLVNTVVPLAELERELAARGVRLAFGDLRDRVKRDILRGLELGPHMADPTFSTVEEAARAMVAT